MRYYPVNLDIKSKECLVVGGGSVSSRKVATLLKCGTKITVVSPEFSESLQKLSDNGTITIKERLCLNNTNNISNISKTYITLL